MKNNTIAFYPYSYNSNMYIGMIQDMFSEKFDVVDYSDLKKGIFSIKQVDAIYLNWIEDSMNEDDKSLIIDAVSAGIKVYWVFHNRISHDPNREEKCRENIVFLIKNVSNIIILSHASRKYLYEYVPEYDEGKVRYLPHQEYIGNYGTLEDKGLRQKLVGAELVFGSLGNIRQDKNIELLIRAFKKFSGNKKCKLLIVGGTNNREYLDKLEGLRDNDENILLIPERIPDYMMDFYVQLTDIVLLPYDLKSCMNSGVMLLAFSNRRTIISTNIAMAEEFDEKLIYKYTYLNEENHVDKIVAQMEKAYADGKSAVREKGELLYQEIISKNSKEVVQSKLYEILGEISSDRKRSDGENQLLKVYRDKVIWRLRYAMADVWLQNTLSENSLVDCLKENDTKKVAIYGYGKYGKLLYSELQKKGIAVSCIIDQNADNMHAGIPACTLENLKEPLDVVIVTTVLADLKLIKKHCWMLNSDCYVISLKDI